MLMILAGAGKGDDADADDAGSGKWDGADADDAGRPSKRERR